MLFLDYLATVALFLAGGWLFYTLMLALVMFLAETWRKRSTYEGDLTDAVITLAIAVVWFAGTYVVLRWDEIGKVLSAR